MEYRYCHNIILKETYFCNNFLWKHICVKTLYFGSYIGFESLDNHISVKVFVALMYNANDF